MRANATGGKIGFELSTDGIHFYLFANLARITVSMISISDSEVIQVGGRVARPMPVWSWKSQTQGSGTLPLTVTASAPGHGPGRRNQPLFA